MGKEDTSLTKGKLFSLERCLLMGDTRQDDQEYHKEYKT
jgi:hypothetical protein